MYSPTTSWNRSANRGSRESLKGRTRCGLRESVRNSVYGPDWSSQSKPALEEDGELGLGHAPLARRHLPVFGGQVQYQIQQLQHAVVGREVAAGAHRPAQLGIQALDGIGC